MRANTTGTPRPAAAGMPKWLLYGLLAKGILVVAVTVGVLVYAGVL